MVSPGFAQIRKSACRFGFSLSPTEPDPAPARTDHAVPFGSAGFVVVAAAAGLVIAAALVVIVAVSEVREKWRDSEREEVREVAREAARENR